MTLYPNVISIFNIPVLFQYSSAEAHRKVVSKSDEVA